MIPANKRPFWNDWFAGQVKERIERAFGAVRTFGLERTRAHFAERPALLVCNHTSYWDPMFAIYASNALMRLDGYAMMDAKNLRKYAFFSWVGAFGVDLEDPGDGAASMRYAARLLSAPGRGVWIYPQGRERPVTERPLGFRPGAAQIARVAKAHSVPVGLRYEFGGEERPVLYASFGEPIPPSRDVARAQEALEAAVEGELSRIEAACRADAERRGGHGFEEVYRARESAIGRLAARMLHRVALPGLGPAGRSGS